jgi:hypothetical protein
MYPDYFHPTKSVFMEVLFRQWYYMFPDYEAWEIMTPTMDEIPGKLGIHLLSEVFCTYSYA